MTMREESGRLAAWWYVAATSKELRADKPLGRMILGEKLVVFRGADGAAVAMSDRCLHRNAPLSEGDVFDGCIGCPYHGWTYDASGRVIGIPAQEEGAPLPDARLKTWPVVERFGLVWVWMGDDPPHREPFTMPYWDTKGWTSYYMVTDFDNGVTQLVENFMDVPHTVFVHKGWFRTESRTRVEMTVERTSSSVLVTYQQPKDRIGFTSRILNPRNEPMVHTDKFYLPNVTRVDYSFGKRGFVITSTCTPETPYKSRVYTLISYNLGRRLFNNLALPFLPWYTRRVIRQDVDIMAIQGNNLRHHGTEAFHHAQADLHHQWIEALRDWAVHEQGDPPAPVVQQAAFWV